MVYEKKAQSALEEFLDAIYYEEGRLALINKLGPALSDEDKAKATQLITAQRGNLDRLLELFKKDLEPLMSDICKNGEAMAPLVSKLLSTGTQVYQVEESTNSNEAVMIAGAPVEAAPVNDISNDTAVMVNADVSAGDTTIVADAPVAEVPTADSTTSEVASDVPVAPAENNEVVAASGDTTVVAEGATMEGVGDNAPAAEITSNEVAAPAEGNGGEVVTSENSAVTSDGTGSEVAAEVPADAPVTEAAPVEEAAPFVLSPMDEDVAPVPSKEEVQAAEEGVAAADQQLQTIEGMKSDIINDTSLTDTEKTVSLGKYTRMTADAVRAILVTKAQYEKLLASRDAQKGLLKPEGGLTEATGDAVAAEEASAEVSASGDAVTEEGTLTIPGAADTTAASESAAPEASATEAAPEVGGDSVIPAIVGGDNAPVEAAASTDNGGGFLPTIETGTDTSSTIANDAPVEGALVLPMINNDGAATAPVAEATSGELVIPGAVSAPAENASAEASGANELQAMIEQANALYKEGKTAEAQALFEKIGAMNKESTGDGASAEVADAAKVLVKQ